MSRQVEATVDIDARPETVWQVLADFRSYSDWNPLLPRVVGHLEEGARVRALLAQRGFPPVGLLPEILVVDEPRELRWRSEPPFPGVFAAEHAFLLEPLDGGERTRFRQTETFEGALAGAIPASLVDRVREGFVEMNEALRYRAESTVPVTEES
jgi:hypothetical protein